MAKTQKKQGEINEIGWQGGDVHTPLTWYVYIYIYPICTSICQPRPSRANRSRAEAAAPLSPPSTICAVRHCKQAMGPPLVLFHQHLYTLSKRTRHDMRVSHHVSHVRTLIYTCMYQPFFSSLDLCTRPTNQPTEWPTNAAAAARGEANEKDRYRPREAKQHSKAKQIKAAKKKRK